MLLTVIQSSLPDPQALISKLGYFSDLSLLRQVVAHDDTYMIETIRQQSKLTESEMEIVVERVKDYNLAQDKAALEKKKAEKAKAREIRKDAERLAAHRRKLKEKSGSNSKKKHKKKHKKDKKKKDRRAEPEHQVQADEPDQVMQQELDDDLEKIGCAIADEQTIQSNFDGAMDPDDISDQITSRNVSSKVIFEPSKASKNNDSDSESDRQRTGSINSYKSYHSDPEEKDEKIPAVPSKDDVIESINQYQSKRAQPKKIFDGLSEQEIAAYEREGSDGDEIMDPINSDEEEKKLRIEFSKKPSENFRNLAENDYKDNDPKIQRNNHKLKSKESYEEDYDLEMKYGMNKPRGRLPRKLGDMTPTMEINRSEKLSDNLRSGEKYLKKTIEKEISVEEKVENQTKRKLAAIDQFEKNEEAARLRKKQMKRKKKERKEVEKQKAAELAKLYEKKTRSQTKRDSDENLF